MTTNAKAHPVAKMLITGGCGFIGTNLVADLLRDGVEHLNLDIAEPLCSDHTPSWKEVDILDREALHHHFQEFAPTQVVHLAARTDCDETESLEGYRQNTEGTQNLLDAVSKTPSVARLVVASTQFVCRPGHVPQNDDDYAPHTVYGQSKVITEKLTRQADPNCTWTIVRPTTIWGPWLIRHRDQVFRIMRRGLYVHPGRKPCMRSWGYVGNVVQQIRAILSAPPDRVHRQTLYVGDPVRDLRLWVDGFSERLAGRGVRVVPRAMVRALAVAGDLLEQCGKRFPITSSRYESMTQDYIVPIERTWAILGDPIYSLEDGIAETLAWLDQQGWPPHKSNGNGMTATSED